MIINEVKMHQLFTSDPNKVSEIAAQGLNIALPESAWVREEFEKYFLSAFFYLSKRFGNSCPENSEDFDGWAGQWVFRVDAYFIVISLDSSSMSFSLYGDIEKWRLTSSINSTDIEACRHAELTIRLFATNMLSPIWLNDVPYNILGRCDADCEKYSDNIAVEFLFNYED